MRIEGERRFAAPRDQVFAALVDPAVVASALPGVREWDASDPDRWTMSIRVPVPLAPALRVAVEVLEREAPARARLRGAGGALGGGARVDTSFDLDEPQLGHTLMRWAAEIELSGFLSTLLGATIEPLVRRQAERMLDAIAARVEPQRPEAA